MTTSGVQAAGLTVRLGSRTVLEQLDFSVATGVHGLLGRNGAGKTTLMRTIGTLLEPGGGSLHLLGQPIPSGGAELLRLRARIGYAPQADAALPHLRVLDYVIYAGWLKGMSEVDARVRAASALEHVGLSDRARVRSGKLSGGMLKRLAIAAATVHDPALLLLDEPTAGLDPAQRALFRQYVTRLGQSRTVVLSTHLIEDVVAICDTVTVVSQGRRVFAGTPHQLSARAAEHSRTSSHEAAFLALTRRGGG